MELNKLLDKNVIVDNFYFIECKIKDVNSVHKLFHSAD